MCPTREWNVCRSRCLDTVLNDYAFFINISIYLLRSITLFCFVYMYIQFTLCQLFQGLIDHADFSINRVTNFLCTQRERIGDLFFFFFRYMLFEFVIFLLLFLFLVHMWFGFSINTISGLHSICEEKRSSWSNAGAIMSHPIYVVSFHVRRLSYQHEIVV